MDGGSIPDYEDPDFTINDPYGTEFELSVLERSVPKHNRWALDAGCGYGRLSEIICERSDRVIFLDYSLSNLRRAKEKYYLGESKRYFILADIGKLPLKDGSLNLITSIRVLHHLSTPEIYISEFSRCLVPGGYEILSFNSGDNAAILLSFIINRILGTNLMGIGFNPLSGKTVMAGNSPPNRRIYFYRYGHIIRTAKSMDLRYIIAHYHGGISDSASRHGAIVSNISRRAENAVFGKKISRYLFPNSYMVFSKSGSIESGEHEDLEDILACPICRTDIRLSVDKATCTTGHSFPLREGIIDFRIGMPSA